MQFGTVLILSLTTFASVYGAPQRRQRPQRMICQPVDDVPEVGAGTGAGGGNGNANGNGNGNGGAVGGGQGGAGNSVGAITRGASTLVLKETGGVPGNECLTFRNNGEIVDAACVNAAADRQITPSTAADGTAVLLVQRSFSAGFRPDLVNVQACVGFNGTVFKALNCADPATQFVTLVNGHLKSGTACHSGHDARAQLTVDTTGANCVGVTQTTVTATAP